MHDKIDQDDPGFQEFCDQLYATITRFIADADPAHVKKLKQTYHKIGEWLEPPGMTEEQYFSSIGLLLPERVQEQHRKAREERQAASKAVPEPAAAKPDVSLDYLYRSWGELEKMISYGHPTRPLLDELKVHVEFAWSVMHAAIELCGGLDRLRETLRWSSSAFGDLRKLAPKSWSEYHAEDQACDYYLPPQSQSK